MWTWPNTRRMGCSFRIFEVAPSAVAEIGMRQLMGDHIIGEIFRAIRQSGFEDHAATAVSRPGARHPDGASVARNIIIQRQSKARIAQEVGEHLLGQPLQHRYDTESQVLEFHRSLDVAPEVSVLSATGFGHSTTTLRQAAAPPQAGRTQIASIPRSPSVRKAASQRCFQPISPRWRPAASGDGPSGHTPRGRAIFGRAHCRRNARNGHVDSGHAVRAYFTSMLTSG